MFLIKLLRMLDLITILGPTASGKTSLAVALAATSTPKLSVRIPVRYIVQWISVQVKTLSEYTYEEHAIPII